MNTANEVKGMVISVGGAPDAVKASVRHYQPERAVFIVSDQSRALAADIVKENPALRHYEYLRIADPSSLTGTYRTIREQLMDKLEALGLGREGVVVDFTAGTKVMSAALVLVATELGFDRMNYVDGSRLKEGLGTVVTGTEIPRIELSPWAASPSWALREAAAQADAGRYDAATAFLKRIQAELPARRDQLRVAAVAGLFHFLHLWDRQRYREAQEALKTIRRRQWDILQLTDEPLAALYEPLFARFDDLFLEFQQVQKEPGPVPGATGLRVPLDLLSAAVRRVTALNDAEDGLMYVYSALEKTAKYRLFFLGIDNSNCQVSQLGALAQDECFVNKHRHPDKPDIVLLPLDASFRLLRELGDSLGRQFEQRWEEILKVILYPRNHCFREHGHQAVDMEKFNRALPLALTILGCSMPDLTVFPLCSAALS